MKKKFQLEKDMLKKTVMRDGDFTSIRDVFERINRMFPDNPLLSGVDENKKMYTYTVRDYYEEIMNLGGGLIGMGLKDAHIAIIADNSCRYVIADNCISSGVGVVMPIDVDGPEDLLVTLLTKGDATAVLCGARVLEKVRNVARSCPLIKAVITIDKKVEGTAFYDDVVAEGKKMGAENPYRTMVYDPSTPSKMLFTSGTTGANKAVLLTGENLVANVLNCIDVVHAEEGNTSMSILPFHHATEINTHVMCRICGARHTFINDSIRNMMPNMRLFKPDTVTIVPMIANAFYKNIWEGAKKAGKDEKLRKGIKLCNLLRKFGIDKTHEMFPDVFAPFGGRLSFIVCGGAMLNPKVVAGLNDLGIKIENGYGITECGPLISMNSDTLHEHLSVGKPCPKLEARIDKPDENGVGELCIKGKSVAGGYYKDEEGTAKVFDKDGFFHTGDSARIDAEGRIFLTGRKKNTIVLDNGKNICPEEVENVIETALEYATDIVVYQATVNLAGADAKVLCAGIFVPEEERRKDRDAIAQDIRKINANLPSYKHIDYVELPDKEYEKTSTHKIRRTSLPTKCSGNGIEIK